MFFTVFLVRKSGGKVFWMRAHPVYFSLARAPLMVAAFHLLYYYDFDRYEILQQILSLGAAATVLAPADMREAIIERLQEAWQNLQ